MLGLRFVVPSTGVESAVFAPAILALEDGSIFLGCAIGAEGQTVGEVVFNTALTGYQEILTDPSYARQIVTLTYPHIGNVGCCAEDEESGALHCAGLIIRDLPLLASNFRSEQSLDSYLKEHKLVAIADIDTRRLTRLLREKGALAGCIATGENLDANALVAQAKGFSGLQGVDLAQEVGTAERYEWREGEWALGEGHTDVAETPYHVVAYDFGVKRNILRMLASRGCRLTVVPPKTPAAEVMAMNPDGVFLSNGPGDPEPCDYAIAAIQEVLAAGKPVFGICLGHQLLSLAVGATTLKMKFGHHGANHPVQCLSDKRVYITSQNHGFAVDDSSLPANVEVTHRSLFDGSLQGIRLTDKPAFGFQGHPEASPGPQDIGPLFDQFIQSMKDRSGH